MPSAAVETISPDKHIQQALVFEGEGRLDLAVDQLQRALHQHPQSAALHLGLGHAYAKQQSPQQAIEHFQRSLALAPNQTPTVTRLAEQLNNVGRLQEALQLLHDYTTRRPDQGEAWLFLGHLYRQHQAFRRAATCYEQAHRWSDEPDIDTLRFYAESLVQSEQFEPALPLYRQLLDLAPDDALIHFNYSIVLLTLGHYEKAWAEYAWREYCPFRTVAYPHARSGQAWKGQDLQGKSLFVYSEQGLGDTIQFLRYLPLLKERGARLYVEVHSPLVALLECCPVIDSLLCYHEAIAPRVEADYHVSFMDLPARFATTLDTIPPCPTDLLGAYSTPSSPKPKPKQELHIGLVWAGNPHHADDARRSCTLDSFAPLAAATGVKLYSLQHGSAAEQCLQVPWSITDLGRDLESFRDTAAALQDLDLVITVDTAMAHLAGTLGKTVWVLLPTRSDWRWLRHRSTSPWYPSMELFRQTHPGDWSSVIDRVRIRLQTLQGASPLIESPESKDTPRMDTLKQAIVAHQNGHLQQASQYYQAALLQMPRNAQALHGFALVRHQEGQTEEALSLLDRALKIQDQVPQFHNTRGVFLESMGQWNEAILAYERALILKPNYAEAANNRAIALQRRGDLTASIQACLQTLAIDPNFAPAYYTLGYCQQQQNQLTQARDSFHRAIALDPRLIDAYNQMGITLARLEKYEEALPYYEQALERCPEAAEIHNNLGIALRALGRAEAAVEHYRQAIALLPDFPEAYHNLAHAETDLKRFEQAEKHARHATALAPDYAAAYNQLGIVLNAAGRPAEAVTAYQQAIARIDNCAEFYNNLAIAQKQNEQWDEAEANYRLALKHEPNESSFHTNLANLLKERARCTKALKHYDRAIELQPHNADAHWNRALCHLLNGNLQAGWRDYQWRTRAPLESKLYLHHYAKPRWEGQSFQGQRLLVHSEQGLGDTLQFVRYLAWVKQRGGTVILETWPELVTLLSKIEGIDACVATRPEPYPEADYDLCASIMDLPGLFGGDSDRLPQCVPYVFADPNQVQTWEKRFMGSDLNIGLVWAGRPTHGNDKNRSCSLHHFQSLLRLPGLRFYGLQKGNATQQITELPVDLRFENLGDRFDDLAGTAAAISALDLVITVDTAVAHLAGALGKTVWTLLPYAPDWRWMLHRTDSPWYPTMRLIRQPEPGDWASVFIIVNKLLQSFAQACTPASSLETVSL